MNEQKRRAVLWDLDGTLVNTTEIQHLLGTTGGIDAFHAASADCPPNRLVVRAARQVHHMGFTNLVLTERMEQHRTLSERWLHTNNVPYTQLLMRSDGDPREDRIVKKEMYDRVTERYDVVHAWDDRPETIRLWRSLGLLVTIVPGCDDRLPES